MIYFSKIEFANLIIHSVGNKLKGDTLLTSDSSVILGDEIEEVLLKFMTTPFKQIEFHTFGNLDRNSIYKSVKTIFNMNSVFITESKKIAKYLFDNTKNEKVFGGNLFIVHFKDCIVGDEMTDAIGIFKSELTDTYLKIKPSTERFVIEREAGIHISKLAKGCIIYNYEAEDGYLIEVFDKRPKNAEISYWSDNFLNIVPRQDAYHQTTNVLSCAEHFIKNGLPDLFDISRADQINLLHKTVEWFKENDEFNWNEYSNQTFETKELIDEFDAYKDSFEQDNDVIIAETFPINLPAVKKQAKNLKSKIKLDDKFEIVIHRGKENLLRGNDEASGLNYYQLFFKNEE